MAKRKNPGKQLVLAPKGRSDPVTPEQLLEDLRALIQETREGGARAVNSTLVLLYWRVGHRIPTEIL